MNKMLARVFSLCLIASVAAPLSAQDLSQFGIGSIETISENQGSEIRGAGFASSESTAMTAMQIFIFDSVGGSSINLSSSSINHSSDHGDIDYESAMEEASFVSSATQSVSTITDLDFNVGDFNLTATEFALGAWGDSAAAGTTILFDAVQ
ncbi:MAG: hypothetical protein ACON5J_06050 [Rubripirellula sp.]